MAYLGKTPSQAVRSRYYFTATGGETSLSGADDNSKTLVFADGNYVDVTLNGVTLVAGTDYNTTTSNTIGGLTALTASDVVEVVVYDTFSVFSGNFNGDINLGDNVKANFGAGSDLQIYHDGSNSYIDDAGTGNLVIKGANITIDDTSDQRLASFISNGRVELMYAGGEKLRTTSTGVDVTGTVTSDGLTVDGNVDINGNYVAIGDGTATTQVQLIAGTSGNSTLDFGDSADTNIGRIEYVHANDAMTFRTNNSERVRIDSSGNVGIGLTNPSGLMHLKGDTNSNGAEVYLQVNNNNTTDNLGAIHFGNNADETLTKILSGTSGANNSSYLTFSTSSTGTQSEAMRIDSSGNVGIGVTSISNQGQLYIGASGTSTNAQIGLSPTNSSGGQNPLSQIGASADGTYGSTLYFNTRSTGGTVAEAMRIDSSGNVGIGTTSPNSKLTLSTGDKIFVPTGEALNFGHTDGSTNTERMRIDSSGKVGIGTSSPARDLEVTGGSQGNIRMSGTNGGLVESWDSAGKGVYFGSQKAVVGTGSSADSAIYVDAGQKQTFWTSGYQRMTIESNGQLLIGNTSHTYVNTYGGVTAVPYGNGWYMDIGHNSSAASGDSYIRFYRNNSGIGSITQNGTTGVNYNTSSDYRLKENAVDLTGAITRVKSLQPKRFNFIADDSITVDGFMAHEAATVVPEAVVGTHNEVDADGNPVYQGIDQSKLVPLLTAALQEAITKIETLETKVTALENA